MSETEARTVFQASHSHSAHSEVTPSGTTSTAPEAEAPAATTANDLLAIQVPASRGGAVRRSPRLVFGAFALLYAVSGLAALPMYRYQLNPDGVSYLKIAEHYSNGDWSETVNGLWSPLFSWLLAPLLGTGANPLLAAHGLNLAIGLLALAGFWALSGRYTDRLWLRTATTTALLPVLLTWSFSLVTPDLLLVALLLWYLVILTAPNYSRSLRYAVGAGVLGGLAYLAKGYAFLFFLVHFIGVNGWRAFLAVGEQRRIWLKRLAAGLACFAVISGPWVLLISVKYGHPTQSTTMGYNWKLMGPTYRGEHLTYRPGLLDPTGPHAVSAWEDPTRLPMSNWSATQRPVYFAELVTRNIGSIATTLQRFSLLALPIVVLGAVFIRSRRGLLTAAERSLLQFTGFTLALIFGGYAVVKVEPRYIWLVSPLLILAAALLLSAMQRRRVRRVGTAVAVAALVASFWLPAVRDLAVERGTGAPNAATSSAMKREVPGLAGRAVASNAEARVSLYLSSTENLGAVLRTRPNLR